MFVFSHGFGVQKDSRGMFDDIAGILPGESLQFDYNVIDPSQNTMTVTTFEEMTAKLTNVTFELAQPINLICHSQGCLVAALANLPAINAALLLGPATTTDSSKFMQVFEGRENTFISRTEDSTLGRRDGSTTIVPAEYWQSLDGIESAEQEYVGFAARTKLTVITAEADEIVEKANFYDLRTVAPVSSISGSDHNFTGDARALLLSEVAKWAMSLDS